jgi:hypothetical protein
MPNFKSAAKRKRELAKLDKRQAKDQKRALRRAEGPDTVAASTPALGTPPTAGGAAPAKAPLTLAEAVERWKNTRLVQPKRR